MYLYSHVLVHADATLLYDLGVAMGCVPCSASGWALSLHRPGLVRKVLLLGTKLSPAPIVFLFFPMSEFWTLCGGGNWRLFLWAKVGKDWAVVDLFFRAGLFHWFSSVGFLSLSHLFPACLHDILEKPVISTVPCSYQKQRGDTAWPFLALPHVQCHLPACLIPKLMFELQSVGPFFCLGSVLPTFLFFSHRHYVQGAIGENWINGVSW